MAHIFAFVTADVVMKPEYFDQEELEDYSGWVDPQFNRFELHESRNYVRPIVDCDESDPDLADYVREALESFGPLTDEGTGSFYAVDEESDDNGNVWTYALHFTRKHHGPNGWTEDPWHPVSNGGLTLYSDGPR